MSSGAVQVTRDSSQSDKTPEEGPGGNKNQNELAARPGRPRSEFVCPMEGMWFTTRKDKHIKSHTREKPFICFKCDKCFSTKYCLNGHLVTLHQVYPKTHSGVSQMSQYRCSDCDDKFPRMAQLMAHRRLLHGHIQKPVNAATGSRAQIPVVTNTRVRGETPSGKSGSRGAISIGNRGNKLKKWNARKGSCMEITICNGDPLAPSDEEPESGCKETTPEHAPRSINTSDNAARVNPPQSDPNPVPSSAPVNEAGVLVPLESTNAGNRALTQLVTARTGVPTQPTRSDGSPNLKFEINLTLVKTSASESSPCDEARNQGSPPTDQHPSSNLMEPVMIKITTATSTVRARRAIMKDLCPAMFRGVPPGEFVDASEFQDDVVKALLWYIYSGETELLNNSAKIPDLLQIARKYELDFIRANKQPVILSESYKRLIKSEHAPQLIEIFFTFV